MLSTVVAGSWLDPIPGLAGRTAGLDPAQNLIAAPADSNTDAHRAGQAPGSVVALYRSDAPVEQPGEASCIDEQWNVHWRPMARVGTVVSINTHDGILHEA